MISFTHFNPKNFNMLPLHLLHTNHYFMTPARTATTTNNSAMTKTSENLSEASSSTTDKSRELEAALLSTSPATIKPSPHSSFRMIDLLTKSTIYRRHDARLARSLALRDDPRPAPIRVMSGLPGFRIVFRPYRPESQKNLDRLYQQHRGNQLSTSVLSGAFSEETLFDRYSNADDDNAVVSASTGTATTNNRTNSFAPERILQAMLATGVSAGVAEYIFAYWKNNRTSQFATTASPFYNSNNSSNAFQNSHFPRALSVALPTSLLFGTKVLLDSMLGNQQTDANVQFEANHILSSACAGAVVGSSQFALLKSKSPAEQLPKSSLSTMHQQHNTSGLLSLMRRNVVAAVLYFSIYDGVSSLSTRPSNQDAMIQSSNSAKKGTLDILAGGALAGVAHTAAMHSHRYGQYGSMIWCSRVMVPAITRAAPIHAFVFYGYEKMKGYANAVP